ncbi:hypothetical protein TSUD_403550 [Trifolium subterraneum]|uniref:CR-type domain-containing protein n=1 Tax=Trifolium subterraneum TaxID=3900 RepID=A0A2Z6NSL9_TRISU|nr:hypothetical protein TSUD_403550 [Trifolium subterraneum]
MLEIVQRGIQEEEDSASCKKSKKRVNFQRSSSTKSAKEASKDSNKAHCAKEESGKIVVWRVKNLFSVVFNLRKKGQKTWVSMTCVSCQGSGMKIFMRQLGDDMIQQMQQPCNECKGNGEMINYKE